MIKEDNVFFTDTSNITYSQEMLLKQKKRIEQGLSRYELDHVIESFGTYEDNVNKGEWV